MPPAARSPRPAARSAAASPRAPRKRQRSGASPRTRSPAPRRARSAPPRSLRRRVHDRVVRVLPGDEARGARCSYSTNPSPSRSPHWCQNTSRSQAGHRVEVEGPAVVAPCDHQEQRRSSSGAVVRHMRDVLYDELADPQLVQDLPARRRATPRRRRPEPGERQERSASDFGEIISASKAVSSESPADARDTTGSPPPAAGHPRQHRRRVGRTRTLSVVIRAHASTHSPCATSSSSRLRGGRLGVPIRRRSESP